MTYPHEPLQEGLAPSIELQPSPHHGTAQGKDTYTTLLEQGPKQSSSAGITGAVEDRQSPASSVQRRERWNHPRINIARMAVCFYGFVIMGANDAAYGVKTQRSPYAG